MRMKIAEFSFVRPGFPDLRILAKCRYITLTGKDSNILKGQILFLFFCFCFCLITRRLRHAFALTGSVIHWFGPALGSEVFRKFLPQISSGQLLSSRLKYSPSSSPRSLINWLSQVIRHTAFLFRDFDVSTTKKLLQNARRAWIFFKDVVYVTSIMAGI